MLNAAMVMAAKDVRLIIGRGAGLVQALLLGMLLIFLFSLSQPVGELVSAQTAATTFWLATVFCLVLASTMCHGTEDPGTRAVIMLSPVPVQAIWLGKGMAILCILFAAQAVFLPATVAFLRQPLEGFGLGAFFAIVLVDVGLAAAGALFGSVGHGSAARESLVSILLFPLLMPVLVAGIRITGASFGLVPAADSHPEEMLEWLGIAAAFDAMLAGAGLGLFQFVFTGEE